MLLFVCVQINHYLPALKRTEYESSIKVDNLIYIFNFTLCIHKLLYSICVHIEILVLFNSFKLIKTPRFMKDKYDFKYECKEYFFTLILCSLVTVKESLMLILAKMRTPMANGQLKHVLLPQSILKRSCLDFNSVTPQLWS